MKSFIRFSKIIVSKKNEYNDSIYTPELTDINKPIEEKLSGSIKIGKNDIVFQDNENSVYDLLIKIKNFKEFISLNNINKEIVLNMIKSGILKLFKLNETIFKKGENPEYYFLILIGGVSFINQSKIYTSGNFFGDEILRDIQYKHTAIAQKDKTILLLLGKKFLKKYLLDKIIRTIENIDDSLSKCFKVFKTLNNAIFQRYKEIMIKLFPFTGQIIVSKDDVADAIFIIYRGNCSLNIGINKDLMVLSKNDIFGIESLPNIDKRDNSKDNKYLYNVINKSPDTIIFKFFITDLPINIINALKEQLTSNFLERKNILQSHENMKQILNNKLINKYKFLKKEKKINELIRASSKELLIEKAEKLFNKLYHKIIAQQKFDKIKKTSLIPKRSCLSINNMINEKSLINQVKKSKSSSNQLEKKFDFIDNDRKKIISNVFIKKNIKDIKKNILNSDLKKSIIITGKEKEQIKIDKLPIIKNKNKKNKNLISSTISLNKSDNSYKKNIFFTTVDVKSQSKPLYRKINIKNKKHESIRKIKKNKSAHSIYKDDISKSIVGSTFRDTISFRNKSQLMSSKNQIEIYGCNALDVLNYFNYGEKEKIFNENSYENLNKNSIRKKVIFYETNKYNIPFFAFFDEKEKIKLPNISIIKKNLNNKE